MTSISDRAYETIKNDIITCVLKPGQQVVQAELAERYQFGTTPVREALQRLVQEGFADAIPRFGYVVKPITFADIRELYEVRSIMEVAAARLAAVKGSAEQLQEIVQISNFTYVYRDHPSYSEFLTLNARFHNSVALAAGNMRLAECIDGLIDELTRIFHLGLNVRDSAAEMRDEHVALARALVARDADLAERLVRSQITRSQERVIEEVMRSDIPIT